MLAQTVEYALRALGGAGARPGDPQTNRQLAKVTKVPGPYLSKVLQLLAKEGFIAGFAAALRSAAPARQITILEAVNAVDPAVAKLPIGVADEKASWIRLLDRKKTNHDNRRKAVKTFNCGKQDLNLHGISTKALNLQGLGLLPASIA